VSERAGATLLVSEDMQAGRRLGGVTVLNPFEPDGKQRLGLA
jgi:predicted nucleic acid-binding protein